MRRKLKDSVMVNFKVSKEDFDRFKSIEFWDNPGVSLSEVCWTALNLLYQLANPLLLNPKIVAVPPAILQMAREGNWKTPALSETNETINRLSKQILDDPENSEDREILEVPGKTKEQPDDVLGDQVDLEAPVKSDPHKRGFHSMTDFEIMRYFSKSKRGKAIGRRVIDRLNARYPGRDKGKTKREKPQRSKPARKPVKKPVRQKGGK